jgi:hypothetical protein
MSGPGKTKPDASRASGDVEGSGELATTESYSLDATVRLTPAGYIATGRPGIAAYLLESMLAGDDEWERLRRTLYLRAHRSDETGERADRMLWESCGRFIPAEVHGFARASGLVAAGIVYGRTSQDRLRRADLLAEIATEAQAVEDELRGSA